MTWRSGGPGESFGRHFPGSRLSPGHGRTGGSNRDSRYGSVSPSLRVRVGVGRGFCQFAGRSEAPLSAHSGPRPGPSAAIAVVHRMEGASRVARGTRSGQGQVECFLFFCDRGASSTSVVARRPELASRAVVLSGPSTRGCRRGFANAGGRARAAIRDDRSAFTGDMLDAASSRSAG